MARVIRQNFTYRNQNIGVVKASTAGEAMERDFQQGANNLIKNAFNIADAEAKKAGVSLAQNLDVNDLKAINPETGKLEVLENTPLLMGLSARNAYADTVGKRFRFSIEQDIKQEANRLSVLYQDDPKMVSKFETTFGEFLNGIKKPFGDNINNEYHSFVNDMGESYLATTKTFLMDKKMKLERKEAQEAFIPQLEDIGNGISSMISTTQGRTIDLGLSSDLQEKGATHIKTHRDGNIISPQDGVSAQRALNMSIFVPITGKVTESIRNDNGTDYLKSDTQLLNFRDVLLGKQNANILDNTNQVITIIDKDNNGKSYSLKEYAEKIFEDFDEVDKSKFADEVTIAIQSNNNARINQNRVDVETNSANIVQHSNWKNNSMDLSSSTSTVNKIYRSANNGNTDNIVKFFGQLEMTSQSYAGTKTSALKTGENISQFTDSSGVGVKNEVLGSWLRSTGVYNHLSKIGKTVADSPKVNALQEYYSEFLLTQGNPQVALPTLSADEKVAHEKVLKKLGGFFDVKDKGLSMDSYYSNAEVKAMLTNLDVRLNRLQTDQKSAKIITAENNDDNISANVLSVSKELAVEVNKSANMSDFTGGLKETIGNYNNVDSDNFAVKVGDTNYSFEGVSTTTRNEAQKGVADNIATSFIGSAVQTLTNTDQVFTAPDNTTKNINSFVSSANAQSAVFTSVYQALNSNSEFSINTGVAEVDTFLTQQFGDAVKQLNQANPQIRDKVKSTIATQIQLLGKQILQENAVRENIQINQAISSGVPNANFSQNQYNKVYEAKVFKGNVSHTYFRNPASLDSADENYQTTESLYALAHQSKAIPNQFKAQINALFSGAIDDPRQVFTMIQHIRKMSAYTDSMGNELNLLAALSGIGNQLSEDTLKSITHLEAFTDLHGNSQATAQKYTNYLLKTAENKRQLQPNNNYTDSFTNTYAQSVDETNTIKNVKDVVTHYMTNTHKEDSNVIVNRLTGVVNMQMNFDPATTHDVMLSMLDKFYNAHYTQSKGIILDPALRNNLKVQTSFNIDHLIPNVETLTFQNDPSRPDNAKYNGMGFQEVWLAKIQEQMDDPDSFKHYGDNISFILDDRVAESTKRNRPNVDKMFNFGEYNPQDQPQVRSDEVIGTTTKTNRRGKVTEVPEYKMENAPIKVFLVPMHREQDKSVAVQSSDNQKYIQKFRVMRIDDNGTGLTPLLINTDVGDGEKNIVPYIVSFRGSNDIDPQDFLTTKELADAQALRNEGVVPTVRTFNFSDL